MKKSYLAALLTVGLSISAFGAVTVPTQSGDKPNVYPQYAGVSTCEISNSTTSSSWVQCATGSGIVLQIIGSSVASTDFLTLRDTGSISNGASSNLLHYTQGSTPIYGLVLPRFKTGLAVNPSVTPVAGTGFWTIIYSKDLN